MRFLSYAHEGRSTYGIVARNDDGLDYALDLGGALDGVADLSDLLAQQRLDEARAATVRVAESEPSELLVSDITFERTIPRPGKIFCIGVNYGGRNAEYKDGEEAPPNPSVFVRFPDSLVGHGHDLLRPPESEQLDYEGEIVAVIGRRGRRIPQDRAREHLAGLTLGNEGTIRDWVRHAKFNVTQGKNWESSGSIGPWMVTIDEFGSFDDLHLTTRVNDELRQEDTPASMAYPIEFQIAYLSTFCTLEPGDIIFTGTPIGAGARFDPPRYLRPGDVVEVDVPEIGTLRNGVRDE
jgi:5-carboxymethyl-2-hydroxymuconate isomerase